MPGSALAWEVADGVALVTIDLKGEPVNKISRSVKDDFLATLEALERDRAVQAVAFFSGKPDTFRSRGSPRRSALESGPRARASPALRPRDAQLRPRS